MTINNPQLQGPPRTATPRANLVFPSICLVGETRDRKFWFTASPDLSILSASIPGLSGPPERSSPVIVPLEFVSITAICDFVSSLFVISSPVVNSGGDQRTQSPAGCRVLPTMLVSRGWKTSSAPLQADPFPLIAGGCAFRAHGHPRHISNKRCGTHRNSSESSKNHLA